MHISYNIYIYICLYFTFLPYFSKGHIRIFVHLLDLNLDAVLVSLGLLENPPWGFLDHQKRNTLPETNIAHENPPSFLVNTIRMEDFSGLC